MLAGAAPVQASWPGVRYRLNRGGDRQLNRALHTIVMLRQVHQGRPRSTPPVSHRPGQEPARHPPLPSSATLCPSTALSPTPGAHRHLQRRRRSTEPSPGLLPRRPGVSSIISRFCPASQPWSAHLACRARQAGGRLVEQRHLGRGALVPTPSAPLLAAGQTRLGCCDPPRVLDSSRLAADLEHPHPRVAAPSTLLVGDPGQQRLQRHHHDLGLGAAYRHRIQHRRVQVWSGWAPNPSAPSCVRCIRL